MWEERKENDDGVLGMWKENDDDDDGGEKKSGEEGRILLKNVA